MFALNGKLDQGVWQRSGGSIGNTTDLLPQKKKSATVPGPSTKLGERHAWSRTGGCQNTAHTRKNSPPLKKTARSASHLGHLVTNSHT